MDLPPVLLLLRHCAAAELAVLSHPDSRSCSEQDIAELTNTHNNRNRCKIM